MERLGLSGSYAIMESMRNLMVYGHTTPTRQKTPVAQPFVKWVGGKRSLLQEILPRLPSKVATYYEPFVGGGALYFAIVPTIQRAVLLDSNKELIAAYQAIQTQPALLIRHLKSHARRHNEDYYYDVREREPRSMVTRAARLLYLNKTCYNGLYRVNSSGKFNAPMGRYKSPNIVQEDNIWACHSALQNADCRDGDFSSIRPSNDDFVYFDPPYHPLNATSNFTQYHSDSFNEFDQVRLRDFAQQLHEDGVKLMLSNSDTPLIRDIYGAKHFKKHVVHAPRFVNCKSEQRGKITELLITNY
jgi:DNA adenine methylase